MDDEPFKPQVVVDKHTSERDSVEDIDNAIGDEIIGVDDNVEETELRRSTRARHPPDRYQQSK